MGLRSPGTSRRGVVVVVGTGAGGGVLIEALSRLRPDINVVVVERVEERQDWAALDDGANAVRLEHRPAGWSDGGTVNLPMSPGWGGASLLHGGIALRGERSDYERWQAVAGRRWGPGEVSALIDDVESTSAAEMGNPERRLDLATLSRGERAVRDWCVNHYGSVGSLDPMTAPDAGLVPSATTNDGRVLTVVRSHLSTALRRPNVRIRSRTEAVRLLAEGRRVTGIELRDVASGKRTVQKVDAVVSSAGAIGSAELLLRSGIGPASDLRAVDRAVLVDMPMVGAQLRDHPTIWLRLRAAEGHGSAVQWPWHKVRCRVPATDPDLPNVAIEAFHDFRLRADPVRASRVLIVSYMALDCGAFGSLRPIAAAAGTTEIVLAGMRPDQKDAMIQNFHKLARSGPVADAGFSSTAERSNPRAVATRSAFHLHGTCPMGIDVTNGVVDSELRVFGFDNLFVADAGVIPIAFRANTHLITKAVGLAGARSVVEAL